MSLLFLDWLLLEVKVAMLWGIKRLHERYQDRVTHELVNDPDGIIQLRRRRWLGPAWEAQQVITHMCWKIDFARAVRLNVGLHQFLPQAADVITIVLEALLGLAVCKSVALGFHGEFEGLEAMVLREIGHEGTQSVGLRSRISEDLVQRGHTRPRRRGQADRSGGRHGLISASVRLP